MDSSDSINDPTTPEAGHSNGVLNSIQTAYASQRLSDITLVVGGISYPSHRFILCITSNVFEIMLNSKWSESRKQVIELQEDPQCVEAFPMFLQYFYTGIIPLDQTNVMAILVLADKYNIMDLTVQCVQYMLAHIVEAAEQGHLILWFQYVLSVNQPSLADASYYYEIWKDTGCADIKPPWYNLLEACSSFIKWNLDLCLKSFNTFECDVLIGLLKQSDLVVQDEMQLFGYVASWLNHQSTERLVECDDADTNKAHMSSLTELVMSHIRYPMLLPRQIAELLMVPIVKQNKDFFFEKMAAAMRYHAVETETLSSMGHLLECTPRLYTSQRWGDSYNVCLLNHLPDKKNIATYNSLFEKEGKPKKSYWEIEFTAGRPRLPFIRTPQIVHSRIRKIQHRAENVSRHIRVTFLVYGPQKDVVSVVQNVVLSNESVIDVPILGSIVKELNRIPLKLHVIITPIALGFTDCHVDPIIQHRL